MNVELLKPSYSFEAPSVWSLAYGETRERFVGKEKKNTAKRTVMPATVTTSLYCSPLTVEPSA